MMRAALIAVTSLALAACATVPRQPLADGRILMVGSAKAMLGQPYRWGGAAPGGFDCSGLVFYAAAGAGLRVPRTAAEQYGFGQPIKRADLRAGDLVFMHLADKELHVAIALDAAHFIHAPSRGGYVRIDSLDTRPYAAGFLGARRILPIDTAAVSLADRH